MSYVIYTALKEGELHKNVTGEFAHHEAWRQVDDANTR